MENLARMFGKELFVLDVPTYDTPESVRYLANQYKDMFRFISAQTGEKLDEDKLREAMVKSNKARELMKEAYQLAEHVPSPASGESLANFGIVMAVFLGTDAGIEIAQAYKDEYESMVQNGQSGVPDEKIRLFWLQKPDPVQESADKNVATRLPCVRRDRRAERHHLGPDRG